MPQLRSIPAYAAPDQAFGGYRNHLEQAAQLVRSLFRDGTRLEFANRESVYLVDEQDPYVYMTESGLVKTIAITASGKRCLLSLHPVNDLFGEAALLGGRRPDSAEVSGRTTVRRLHRDRFMAGLAEQDLLDEFLLHISSRMLHQQSVIVDMVTMESERRLAACLLALARDQGVCQGHGVRLRVRMTQQELAEMVGTTRSRIGLFLKNFREAGMIYGTGSSLLVNPDRLAGYLHGSAY